MSDTLFDALGDELARFLLPITSVVEDPDLLDRLMASVGLSTPDAERDALLASLTAITTLKTQIDALLAQPSRSISDVAAVLEISRQAFAALRALDDVTGSSAEFAGFGRDLTDRLITNYLFNWHPFLRSVTALVAIQELAEDIEPSAPIVRDGELVRGSFSVDRFHFDRLVSLIRDPAASLRGEYGNALATSDDAGAMADKLFPRLQRVLRELGVSCRYGFDPDDRPLLGDAAPFLEHALIVYVDDELAGASAEAGIVLTISAADRGDLGLVISPFGTLTSTRQADSFAIELTLTAGVDVVAYGRHGLTLLANAATTEVVGSLSATLMRLNDEPGFIFGAPNGTRIEVGGARLAIDTSLSEARQSLALSADVSSSAIVIAPSDGDGFLSSILPAEGIRAEFDLGLAWSNERGLTFRGAGSLDATLPIGLSIRGGLTVPTIHLSLLAGETGLTAEISVSVGVSIGPVYATIERVGIAAAMTFPETGGNLGVADLDLHFKPPTRLGLVIDAPSVAGGGYLGFDPQKEEYSGMLELQIAETIAVKAIGLLTTRLPGGAKGYSLVVIIFGEDFAPIQLGLGFALTGIGGLLAINRTFDEAALRVGLKNHTLDSILFPQDPIRNAPQILSNLQTVFPAKSGRYVFGPMVMISWGTPTIITAKLGILFELPSPTRLVILGQLRALLPSEQKPLVRLHMDALGIVDFGQKTASLDATLYDSKLGSYTLSGDMALRLKWGSNSTFVLAVGGVHPAYTPPSGFPTLNRIALNLTSGNNPRVRLECYVAITSNTVQVGARVDLYAAAAGFSIEGYLSVDALFQFSPFRFVFEIRADVSLKRGKRTLMSVALDMTLEGPSPWHVKGKATFKVLFFKASVSFDKTFGRAESVILPVVDPLPQLVQALSDPRNWSAQLPGTGEMMVSLRSLPASDHVRMHPLGDLTVRQRVLPLNVELSKFGNTTLSGDRRFTLTNLYLNSLQLADADTAPITEAFAPAQFIDMSDSEKLSRDSFELMQAGLRLGSDAVTYGGQQTPTVMTTARMEYKTVLKTGETQPRPGQPYQPSAAAVKALTSRGAVGRSPLRRKGGAKYVDATTLEAGSARVNVVEPGYVIASRETLETLTEMKLPTNATYTQAREELQRYLVNHPNQRDRLQVVCQHDLAPGDAP